MTINRNQLDTFLVNWYLNEERKRKERIARFRKATDKSSCEDGFDEYCDDECLSEQNHQEKELNEGI